MMKYDGALYRKNRYMHVDQNNIIIIIIIILIIDNNIIVLFNY